MCRLPILLLAVALDGCAGVAHFAMPPRSVQAGSYDCAPADQSSTRHLTVGVVPDRNGKDLDLEVGSRQELVLSPLAHASHQLYSSPSYAWRVGSDVSKLTDIENIQTYDCRQVSGGQAAALSGSGRALP